MSLFTDRLREAARPIWDAQMAHPFVKALGDGTLPRENFEFYIRQDARFLDELTKTFSFAATKTYVPEEMERFNGMAAHTLQVEAALHHVYAGKFGLTVEKMRATPMAPTNYAYTRHLLSICATGSIAAAITAVLPCAWIYAVVGTHFVGLFGGAPPAGHPYADWLATYASADFEETGRWLRERLNLRAEALAVDELSSLENIFLTSSRYEYMFWDMAWRRETWPV